MADILLNVFEAVDVIELLRDGDYSNLNWTVGRALAKRNPNHPGVYTCTLEDGKFMPFYQIVSTLTTLQD